jgi:membrane protein required for colicin V production
MNFLDILLVCIMGYCLVRGIFRGLIKELSSIVGVIAGFYTAYTYYPVISRFLARWMSNSGYRDIAGFLILFCAVLLVVGILSIIIKYLLKIASAGWLDKLLGLCFAAVKGLLIASVLIITLTTFLPKGAGILKGSLLTPHVLTLSEKMIQIVPPEMKKNFDKKFTDLKKQPKRI